MEKFISIIGMFIACFSFCFAQNIPSSFNTIGNVGRASRSFPKCHTGEFAGSEEEAALDSIANPCDSSFNDYRDIPQDKLTSLIGRYEKYLNQRKGDLCNTFDSKVISYYKGSPRELSLYNLMEVSGEVGLSNQLFVLAQALLETGHFSSRVCKEYNNLFGLYDSKNHDYFRFARWEDSVVGYKKMIQYKYKGGNYLHFLKRIGYAEDPRYIPKVAKMAKNIYQRLFGK